ncbi:MAG: septation regulator SpoVG [Bacilli bacterium]|nr:septation regulator SpoVG [Bacilli bacterium]
MKITSVKVHKIDSENSKMKGIATVIIDDCFVVRGIKIIQGEDKLFLSMPSRKVSEGEYQDIVHPINQETRTEFEKAIFEVYNNLNEVE